ncbi:MAG: AAA family ATPase [Deltaproteobacteria bacterium]|nr:AAA family ATPase [Deltaproteobacteria bacterium]
MDYFKILNLSREPFSNSPDPDFFFRSGKHLECLQKIELSLRLLRGLSVITGDVGTGKTTLCRQLIRNFVDDEKVETHLILDPHFSSPLEFLNAVSEILGESLPEEGLTDWQLKENIKKYLFSKGVDEGKTVILIIDEGQKLPDFCLEILREFLNYETNEHKLLQIVIFAQKEFDLTLQKHRNFADRINIYHILGPLNFQETRAMIQFRLERASADEKKRSFFSYPALWAIYRASKGYPRQIINLCHRIILTVLIQNRTKAGWSVARSCAKRDFFEQPKKWQWSVIGALACILAVVSLFVLEPEYFSILTSGEEKAALTEITPLQTEPGKVETQQARSQVIQKERPETPLMALTPSIDLSPEGFSEDNPGELSSDTPIEIVPEKQWGDPSVNAVPAGSAEKTGRPVADQPTEVGTKAEPTHHPLDVQPQILPEEKTARQTLVATDEAGAEKKEVVPSAESEDAGTVIASIKKHESRPDSSVHHKRPPKILGQITVTQTDTLWLMIRKVYGSYSHTYLRSIVRSNKRIRNPNHIMAGQIIRFPVFPTKISPSTLNACFVHVTTKEKLEDAFRFVLTYSDEKQRMEMIPCWDNREGLKFVIVCNGLFEDEESARNALNELPLELVSEAKILGQWEEDTVFFENRVF